MTVLNRETLKEGLMIEVFRPGHARESEVWKISTLGDKGFHAILSLPIPQRTTVRWFHYDDWNCHSITKRRFAEYNAAWDEAHGLKGGRS